MEKYTETLAQGFPDRESVPVSSAYAYQKAVSLVEGYLRSGAELSRAVARLDEVRALALGLPGTAHVPPGRVAALARFATVAKAQAVARLPKERRAATLLAFVRTLEASARVARGLAA